MKVIIQVKGENDIEPFEKIFEYQKSNEFIFFDSIEIIKNKISRNLKLNINETLALFTAYVAVSLNENKSVKEIYEHIQHLLLPNQVLIGVPELLNELTFRVTTEHVFDKEIVIENPIPLQSFKPAGYTS